MAGQVARMLIQLQPTVLDLLVTGGRVRPKNGEDFVTPADLAADATIRSSLATIGSPFPYDSEESPLALEVDGLRWVVDPIDGSQNAAFGLPLCGSTVALMNRDTTVFAVAAETISSTAIWSAGGKVYIEGPEARSRSLAGIAPSDAAPRVSLLRGSTAGGGSDMHVNAYRTLQSVYQRVYENRAPVVDLFLAVRGGVTAFVCTDLAGYETPAVVHLLKALGYGIHTNSRETERWGMPQRFVMTTSQSQGMQLLELLGW